MELKSSAAAQEAWRAALAAELGRLEEQQLLRKLSVHAGRLDFSSNDYLSLNANGTLAQLFRQIVLEAPDGFPVGSTASRLIRGHYAVFDQLESEFAAFSGYPDALFFHSGYAANVGVIDALLGPRDLAFVDRLCHASMLDGVRLCGAQRRYFAHNDLNDLEDKLKRYGGRGRRWIFTEAIFSMDGDAPDLRALSELAERFDALIYLDEAHAFGVRGPGGAGLAAEFGVSARIAVNVFPCGKAPGLMGAFVAGPVELKRYLINRARTFVFSTAQPPLLAEVMRRVLALFPTPAMEAARARLAASAAEFRAACARLGFNTGESCTQIVPVIVGDAERALAIAAGLRERGLDIRAIRPPTVPEGTSRLRVSFQAGHSPEDLAALVAALEDFCAPE